MRAVGHAYTDLAEIASELAKAVEREELASGLLGARQSQAPPVGLSRAPQPAREGVQ